MKNGWFRRHCSILLAKQIFPSFLIPGGNNILMQTLLFSLLDHWTCTAVVIAVRGGSRGGSLGADEPPFKPTVPIIIEGRADTWL